LRWSPSSPPSTGSPRSCTSAGPCTPASGADMPSWSPRSSTPP
jgi:hypothetical protein